MVHERWWEVRFRLNQQGVWRVRVWTIGRRGSQVHMINNSDLTTGLDSALAWIEQHTSRDGQYQSESN